MEKARLIHQQDLSEGYREVYLPYALERKYPNAGKEWAWQYVFPSDNRALDPRSGKQRRHHLGTGIKKHTKLAPDFLRMLMFVVK